MSFLTKTYRATSAAECGDLDRIEALLTSGALLGGLATCRGLLAEQGIADMPYAFLKRLEAGTMPCGWVGPLGDEGGDAEASLRRLAPRMI